jgi:hypothetical protein
LRIHLSCFPYSGDPLSLGLSLCSKRNQDAYSKFARVRVPTPDEHQIRHVINLMSRYLSDGFGSCDYTGFRTARMHDFSRTNEPDVFQVPVETPVLVSSPTRIAHLKKSGQCCRSSPQLSLAQSRAINRFQSPSSTA